MPDSSNPPTQSPAYSASSAEFSAKVEEKIISYMWYIHVMVRVNAADRLRDRIAEYLEQGTTTTTRAPTSPPYSPPFDLDGINHAGGGGGSSSSSSSSSSTFGHEGDIAGAASRMDNLVDYLVLRLFSRVMLEALIHTAPIDEHTDGYARVLASIPAHFRDEFCRRLYRLLFSKYILEWPRGIAVPDPGPGSIADADAAAAAAANAGSETVVSGGRRSSVHIPRDGDNDDKEDEFMFNMDNIMTNEERDDIFDGEKYKHPVNQEPESPGYQSTLGPSSPWPDTPSLGNSPELARAAYFGTVSSPLPIQYLGSWGRRCSRRRRSSSSRDDGPARAAYAGAGACAGTGGAAAGPKERLASPSRNLPQQPVPSHAATAATATTTTTTTTQARPASLLVPPSAHSRDHQQQVSHTGCCPHCHAGGGLVARHGRTMINGPP